MSLCIQPYYPLILYFPNYVIVVLFNSGFLELTSFLVSFPSAMIKFSDKKQLKGKFILAQSFWG